MDRQDRIRLIRRMIDAALEGAPDDICRDPKTIWEGSRPHPFSSRFVSAVFQAGFGIRTTEAIQKKRVNGIMQRMDMEDLIDMTLIAAQRKGVADMLVNDQARDRMADMLCDTFSRRITLVKRKR